MARIIIAATVSLLVAVSQVQAANDWNVPCFSGNCEFDVARSDATIPATMKVWANEAAISDITRASGWHILGCDPNADVQDIRITCEDTDEDAAGCSHIKQNGAVGTLVRLPENCGKAPFAVVKTWGESEDQTIPEEVSKIIRRSVKRAEPVVMALQLDSTFDSADPTHGVVSFAIVGASIDDAVAVPPATARRSTRSAHANSLARRGFFSKIKDIFTKVKDTVKETVTKIVDKVEEVADDLNSVDVNKTFSFPINVDKSVNLASATLQCPPLPDMSLTADAAVKAKGAVTLGAVVAGTIIPINVDTFSLSAGLNAELSAQLTMKVSGSGSVFDSQDVQLFTVGIPGLDIPGVFQLGPTFAINGRVVVNMGAQLDMVAGINYKANNVVFQFPPNSEMAGTGEALPSDSPLTLSLSPDVKLTGDVTAHITPSLKFGVNILNGKAEAEIFLNLDTFASLTANVDGKIDLSKTIQTRRIVDSRALPGYPSNHIGHAGSAMYKPKKEENKIEARALPIPSRIGFAGRPTSNERRDFGANINGCIGMTTGVSGDVGATGKFFSLFDGTTKQNLFKKEFQLFNKCFGAATPKRSIAPSPFRRALAGRQAKTLTCPSIAAPAAEKLTEGTVAAADIKPVA